MNVELNHAETALQAEEAALHAELTRLSQVSAELSTRLGGLRAQAAEVGAQEIARRAQAAPPALDPDAGFARAVAAREAAVTARREANAAARAQVQATKAQLQKLAQQVLSDEKAVQAAKAAAEEAKTLRALAPVAPPPQRVVPRAELPVAAAKPPRRASPRVKMQASIDFTSDDNFFNGFSANISDGGLFVATVNLLPLGTEVDLHFTLPSGERIESKGVVQWVREVNDKHPDVFPGMGVQFKDLTDAAQSAITGFVSQREPLFYDAA